MKMKKKKVTKYFHEGKYAAAVDVELIYDENEWSPYLKLEDALKLDEVRDALKEKDLERAAHYSEIYELHKIAL